MKKLLAALLATAAILASCAVNANPEPTPTAEPLPTANTPPEATPSEEPWESQAPNDETSEVLRFEVVVAEHLPAFTIEIENVGEPNGREAETFMVFQYEARICSPREFEPIAQSFTFNTYMELDEDKVNFVDIDYDGYLDIEIEHGRGLVNRTLLFHRYNIEYNLFENTPFFALLANGYSLHPDTKQIVASTRSNAHQYERTAYQLTNTRHGTYEEIGREWTDYDYDTELYTMHIVHRGTKVYMREMTNDEYRAPAPERENYLRFGVANKPESTD